MLRTPERHAGKIYKLTAAPHTLTQLAETFSLIKRRPVRYFNLSPAAFEQHARAHGGAPWEVAGLLECAQLIEGGCQVLKAYSADYRRLMGVEACSTLKWAKVSHTTTTMLQHCYNTALTLW